MGKNKHPIECSCQRIERAKQEAPLISQQKHSDLVRRLKAEGFSDPAMLDWKFENDNGRSPQMHHAHRYVEQWQTMRAENLGLFLWGGVGTGKSFLAECIANALIEQEVPVHMTNFARILNELNSSFSGRNEVVDKLCRYPLLIIDDFGMERGTEYAREQVYNIVDSRYRSQKPLIVTTNLTLDEIRHPQDTVHARIYDRLLEMRVPISCIGVSLRIENAQEKLHRFPALFSFQKNDRYQLFQNTGTGGWCPQTFSLSILRHILFSGSLHCGQQGILRKVLRWTAFTFFDDCRRNRKGLSFGQIRQSFLCALFFRLCILHLGTISVLKCFPSGVLHRFALGGKLCTGTLHGDSSF